MRKRIAIIIKNTNIRIGTIVAIVIAAILSSLAVLIVPKIIGLTIDSMTKNDKFYPDMLFYFIKIIAIFYALSMLMTWFATNLSNNLASNMSKSLRISAFNKLSKLPLSFFDKTPKGEIASRLINDIEQIDEGLSQGFVQIITSICSIIISIIFMLYLNIYVALSAILVVPLCFVTGYFITRFGRRSFLAQADSIAELNSFTDEVFSAAMTVRAFAYEDVAIKKFEKINAKLYETGWKAQFAGALVNPSTRFVNNIAYVLVGVLSIVAVINNNLTVGGIAAFLAYTNSFSKPINELSAIMLQLQLAFTGLERIADFLSISEEREEVASVGELKINGDVVFEDVEFSYDSSRKIIQNFTLNVQKGQKIAIVGSTGSGKTTLVNLLMRFYDIDKGRIYVDGIDINQVNRQELRRNIGMVLQQTWLFSGTIRENLKYGNYLATDEEIYQAAEKTRANLFIEKMEHGYDTYIAANGENLSVGQKQLICITRVMLMEPSMIIFDEATSNVDILTEKRIQKAINLLMKNKTSFIIAHRLSTIKDSDLIVVLDHGKIIEQGDHDHLIATDGYYAKFYHAHNQPI